MLNRRFFLKLSILGLVGASLVFMKRTIFKAIKNGLKTIAKIDQQIAQPRPESTGKSDVFMVQNGSPRQNLNKTIDMLGGIETFIGKKDIVVIKPNAQWWNQGRTNLASIKAFIDLVLDIQGFEGEIILGENIHFMDHLLPEKERDNIRGWTAISEINGDIDGINHSLNTLIESYHDQGYPNVTKSHWRDGHEKLDLWGNGKEGGVIQSPLDGDGYIWDDNEYTFTGFFGLKSWKVKMSYPVFTSAYSGLSIDLKNGAFSRGESNKINYRKDLPIKFINFAGLNTHGSDTGITSSLKNYMGVTDMSCGYWGLHPKGYSNVHFCGDRYYRHGKAGPIGHFIKTIRKADLNIVTAEWVGWGSRTEVNKASNTKTILAGLDPVALDYIGAKRLVYPLSKEDSFHNPDNENSSIRKYLDLALNAIGEGSIDESHIQLHNFNFKKA